MVLFSPPKNDRLRVYCIYCILFYFIGSTTSLLVSKTSADIGFRVRPVATLFEQFTDNVELSYDDAKHDFVTILSGGFIAEARNKKGNVNFSYNLGRSLYAEFSEYDSWRHYSDMRGEYNFSKQTELQFSNFLRITEDPNEELRERFENIEKVPIVSASRRIYRDSVRLERLRYLEDDAEIKFTHHFSRNDAISLGYGFTTTQNEDSSIQDRSTHRPSLYAEYWPIPKRMKLEGRVGYFYENAKQTASGEPGYTDENITTEALATYWFAPEQFSVHSGLIYEVGVVNKDVINDEDNHYETIESILGAKYDFKPYQVSIDANLSYKRGITYGSDQLSDQRDDYKEWNGSINVAKRYSKSFQLFLKYNHQIFDYVRDNQNNEDYTVLEPTIGFVYLLKENLPFSLGIGVAHRIREVSGSDTGLLVNGEAGPWQFTKRGNARFRASSGTIQQDYGGQDLGFGYYYQGDAIVTYRFSRYMGTDAYSSYRREKFTDNPDVLNTLDEEIKLFGMGVTFQPRKWWYIRLDLMHTNVDATIDTDGYEENQILIRTLWGPEQPFLLN